MRRYLSLMLVLASMALLTAACTGPSFETSAKQRTLSFTETGTSISTSTLTSTHDPQVVVDALNAAGLGLCHSYYNDGAQYNIYGILGATATWQFFPHHSAVPVQGENGFALSCVTSNQPNTGVVEIDVYPSAANASAALRQVGHIWLDAWLWGNVAVLVEEDTPSSIAQEISVVLDHVPNATQVP